VLPFLFSPPRREPTGRDTVSHGSTPLSSPDKTSSLSPRRKLNQHHHHHNISNNSNNNNTLDSFPHNLDRHRLTPQGHLSLCHVALSHRAVRPLALPWHFHHLFSLQAAQAGEEQEGAIHRKRKRCPLPTSHLHSSSLAAVPRHQAEMAAHPRPHLLTAVTQPCPTCNGINTAAMTIVIATPTPPTILDRLRQVSSSSSSSSMAAVAWPWEWMQSI
jgi:hypothetical protein